MIALQLNRLAAHFPRHGTDEDWQVLVRDYVAGLEEYPIEKIELAVWNHIREGEFFPKLSDLVARCKPKYRSKAPTSDGKQIEYRPDRERRATDVAAWHDLRSKIVRKQMAGLVPEFAFMTEDEAAAKLSDIRKPRLDPEARAARSRRVKQLLETPFLQDSETA